MIRAWRRAAGHADEPSGFEPIELPAPELEPDQVSISVEASIVARAELRGPAGRTPGGAAVGTVVDTGDNAKHALGARVAIGPEQPCGECDVCRRGGAAACPSGRILGQSAEGTLASHVVAQARWLCHLDGDLAVPGPSACLIGREAARGYAMLAQAGVAPGEPVVIVGADVVARLLCEIAVAKGLEPMVVLPPDDEAAQWVRSRGGIAVAIEPDLHDPRAVVAEHAFANGFSSRPWYIFETSGLPDHRALATALVGPNACLVALPCDDASHGRHSLDLDTIARANATCIGLAGAHPDLLPEVAALAVRGELDLEGAADVVSAQSLASAREEANASGVLPRARVIQML